MELKIKNEAKERLVFFGGAGKKPLGKRSQKELLDLAILARQSGDKSLLEVFENLPSLQDLQSARVQANLPPVAPKAPAAPKAIEDKEDKGADK